MVHENATLVFQKAEYVVKRLKIYVLDRAHVPQRKHNTSPL
jgi:hypothetical protein